MDHLPDSWYALAALVFALGMKHGLDADHLATIDGLTRFNARSNPRLARCCGILFSLGHGVVVLAVALSVGLMAKRWEVPGWMDSFGALVSIAFLAGLGITNLVAVLTADPREVVAPVGFKGRLLGNLQRTSSPLLIAAVGALFALSFDTLSQASLFALTAGQYGGLDHALAVGLLFTFGMLLTDGINGLWISRLLRRADEVACVASRAMGLVVSGVSLLVAGFGLARFASPALGAWTDGKELAIGLAIVAIVGSGFLFALRIARRLAS